MRPDFRYDLPVVMVTDSRSGILEAMCASVPLNMFLLQLIQRQEDWRMYGAASGYHVPSS